MRHQNFRQWNRIIGRLIAVLVVLVFGSAIARADSITGTFSVAMNLHVTTAAIHPAFNFVLPAGVRVTAGSLTLHFSDDSDPLEFAGELIDPYELVNTGACFFPPPAPFASVSCDYYTRNINRLYLNPGETVQFAFGGSLGLQPIYSASSPFFDTGFQWTQQALDSVGISGISEDHQTALYSVRGTNFYNRYLGYTGDLSLSAPFDVPTLNTINGSGLLTTTLWSPDGDLDLKSVSLTLEGTTSVPESNTTALLVVGLVVFAAGSRRRRSRQALPASS